MKKLIRFLTILTAMFLLISTISAEDWQFQTGEFTVPGTYDNPSLEVKPYCAYVNFRLKLTGTPVDSIACDNAKVVIQTKFSARSDEEWSDLLTLADSLTDTATVDVYLPIDSLLGTYMLGQVIRVEFILSDTITAETTYTDDPWEYRIYVGYH